jgi:DNA polymerase III epsilon subunit-like protein
MTLAIFLDSETNGLNLLRHKCLEIALRVIELETMREVGSYEQLVVQSRSYWDCSDPHSLQVNGFTWEMVQQGKPPEVVGDEIEALLVDLGVDRGNAVFICQNPSFDRPFFGQLVDPDRQEELNWPYHWLDLASMFWAEHEGELQISKDQIAAHFGLPPEEAPHRAMRGVDHLIACYKKLFQKDSVD